MSSTLKQRAFTLIEMLLVIVVLAVVILYAASALQRNNQNTLVDKTAGLLQQYLQASSAFYIQNQKWPAQISDLIPDFLPANMQCTSISQLSQHPPCNQYGNITIKLNDTPENSQYLTVSTPVAEVNLAQQISAKLASGTYAAGQVQASIPIPGAASNTFNANRGFVVSAGIIQAGDANLAMQNALSMGASSNINAIALPNCPAGLAGHVFFAPFESATLGSDSHNELVANYISSGPAYWFGTTKQNYVLPRAYAGRYSFTGGDSAGAQWESKSKIGQYPTVTSAVNASGKKPQAPYLEYFITYCLPVQNWIANPHYPPSSNSTPWPYGSMLSASDLQDGHAGKGPYGSDPGWAPYQQSLNTSIISYLQPWEQFSGTFSRTRAGTCYYAQYPYYLSGPIGCSSFFSF